MSQVTIWIKYTDDEGLYAKFLGELYLPHEAELPDKLTLKLENEREIVYEKVSE